jgi:hypothetical protein
MLDETVVEFPMVSVVTEIISSSVPGARMLVAVQSTSCEPVAEAIPTFSSTVVVVTLPETVTVLVCSRTVVEVMVCAGDD